MSRSPFVYWHTGVARPEKDPADLESRAKSYRELAALASATAEQAQEGYRHVLDHNEGYALDAFRSTLDQETGVVPRAAEYARAASATATAYENMASALRTGVAEMDLITLLAHHSLTVSMATQPTNPGALRKILAQAQRDLIDRQNALVLELQALLPSGLPELQHYHPMTEASSSQDGARVSAETMQRYESLTEAQREEVLQRVSDDYAREHGIDPPPKVRITDEAPTAEWDPSTGEIRINPNLAAGAGAFGTLGHELGHAESTQMFREYESLSFMEELLIERGHIPDPFERYGYTIEDVEQLHEAKEHYDPSKRGYPYHPDEVHSEETRAGVAITISDEQLDEHMDAVT